MVTGRRLDGPAPSFTEIEPISGEREFMGGINIPAFGCWEVTGKVRVTNYALWFGLYPFSRRARKSRRISDRPPHRAGYASPAKSKPNHGPTSAPRRVRLPSEIEAESLVYRVTPETPHEAKVANISGTVVLDAVIGIDGRPHDLRYVSGPTILAQAAI